MKGNKEDTREVNTLIDNLILKLNPVNVLGSGVSWQADWSHTFKEDIENEKQLFENFKRTSKPFEMESVSLIRVGCI